MLFELFFTYTYEHSLTHDQSSTHAKQKYAFNCVNKLKKKRAIQIKPTVFCVALYDFNAYGA